MKHKHFSHRPPLWWHHAPSDLSPAQWRQMRARFFLRFGIFVFVPFVVGCVILTVLASVIANALNVPTPGTGFAFFLIFLGLILLARAVRGVAMPIGDLLDAAGRVAEGDYSARVNERGPREVRVLARAFNSMTARLQAHDELRRNMLADVTHELRTPLTVIQGNLEGLLDGVYPRDDAHLTPILEETRVLSRLIDDLRMLALAESGALKLQKEPTDLATLVSETVASFRVQADTVGVELRADVASDLPTLDLDPARIRQVLENLIANALHFTPRGGQVSVQCSANSNQSKVVTLSVSDTGSGIAPEDLPHIFDRFYKSRDSRGMGLGLAIAKNLVVAHGGEISAQSELGKGTTIRLTLRA